VKLSTKSSQIVQIITDTEHAEREMILKQLIERIYQQEKTTWRQQIIASMTLHPTKNSEGRIVDVSSGEAFFYFLTLGWRLASNICPPAHFAAGWPCFFLALVMIGFVTYLVLEVS
jgi:hypothetical protein